MIIAVLATLIAPRLLERVGTAKQTAAKAQAATIAKTVNLYVLDNGLSAPNDDFDLEVLLLTPDDGGGPQGPYLERAADLIDPWGNPFEILFPPGTVNHSFDIISWGEGGEQGGEGPSKDITQ
jgi:general secretion pathway protein G